MQNPLSKAKRGVMAQLSSLKMRRKYGLFIIEGRKSVEDILFAYPNRFDIEYIAASSQWIADYGARASAELGLPASALYEASAADLKAISSLSTPADVMAVCRTPDSYRCSDTVDGIESCIDNGFGKNAAEADISNSGLYLMLDGVQDPGNLGTIIRTAHWFGISRIFASRLSADLFNPKTIQASMGSLAAMEVIYADLPQIIDANPELPVAGMQLHGRNIYTEALPKAAFIVMGNEGNGLSPEMQQRLTLPLTIPPACPENHAESLNVAIATGITLALFRKG